MDENPTAGVVFDLIAQRAFGNSEGQADLDGGSMHLDVGDHPQFDDVAAQFWIAHPFQGLEDVFTGRHQPSW